MYVATLIVLVVLGQTAEPSRDAAALVEKLGSASYAEREATKSLESLGSKALPPLRPALKSRDPEIRMRARALINKIEGNLLIQESLVRLDFKDATLEEIVKSLSKQAGFEVGLSPVGLAPAGPRRTGTNFGTRRVTLLESQPVPFWKAIDRLCEVGQLTRQYQVVDLRGQGVPQPGLVLSNLPDPLTQPGYNHGPFHVNVVSLSYMNYISFNASDRMRAQVRSGVRGADGVANQKGARPPAEPLPAGAPGPGGAENVNVGGAAARRVQFQVQLQIVPEPRMTLGPAANIQLVEAVDELGHSLLPTVGDDERAFGPTGMMGFAMGTTANLTIRLHRPEAPGKLIKTLRGTVEVSVAAPRSNPLVIPLEGAAGKTFQNDDRRVVVNSIDTDPMRRQDVIELTIEDVDELFPAEPVNGQVLGARGGIMGPGLGARGGMMGPGFGPHLGGDMSGWPIVVRTARGQNAFSQTSIDRDSGRVTLRVPQMPQPGEAKEIRISSIVRATARIPFEFHDLPMP